MRLALFDLDGTLIDRRAALHAWADGFARERGLGADQRREVVAALDEHAYPDTFERLRGRLGLDAPVDRLWAGFVAGMAAGVRPDRKVRAGLDRLRAAGWRVGVLTNGAVDIQRAKLDAAGLVAHVDAVAISDELGHPKPEAAAFRAAARRCGVEVAEAAQAWMVGNSPRADIAGGRAAGLRTIWVRGYPWPDELPPADHAVDRVSDALGLLLGTP